MKILIVVSCLLAASSAGYAGYGGYHIPVIGPHGVPADEPAVAAAKAHHFAAYAEAAARAAPGAGHGIGYIAAAPAHYAPLTTKWHGPIHIPVIGPHGVPVDEPAVQHARAQHAAALVDANHGAYGGYYDASSEHGSVVPLDTPEVAAAKAAHFAAHAEAASHGAYHHYRRRRAVYGGYHGPLPEISHDGTPLDEPAVQAAKAHHLAALAEAAARNGAGAGHGHGGYAQGAPAAETYTPKWHGPIHIPVLNHLGVPVEPHEVQAARANHAAAHSQASSNGGHYPTAPHW